MYTVHLREQIACFQKNEAILLLEKKNQHED